MSVFIRYILVLLMAAPVCRLASVDCPGTAERATSGSVRCVCASQQSPGCCRSLDLRPGPHDVVPSVAPTCCQKQQDAAPSEPASRIHCSCGCAKTEQPVSPHSNTRSTVEDQAKARSLSLALLSSIANERDDQWQPPLDRSGHVLSNAHRRQSLLGCWRN